MNQAEDADTRELTIAEKAKIFAMHYKAGLPLYDAKDHLFRREREKYLTELSRLYRIGKWEKRRDRALQKRNKTTKANG